MCSGALPHIFVQCAWIRATILIGIPDSYMNTCPCIESAKKFLTTGKWEGGGCECGQKLPLSHLLVAGIIGLILSVLVGALICGSRRR